MKQLTMALLMALTIMSCSKEKQEQQTIHLDVYVTANANQWVATIEAMEEVKQSGHVKVYWLYAGAEYECIVNIMPQQYQSWGQIVSHPGLKITDKATNVRAPANESQIGNYSLTIKTYQ